MRTHTLLTTEGRTMEKRHKRVNRADRHKMKILGKITIEEESGKASSFLCNTVNISLSGALVETGSRIPVGALLKYSFSIPGFNIPVNLIGEIVRKDAGEEKGFPPADTETAMKGLNRYGIIFLNLKDDDKRAMESYLARNLVEGAHEEL